MKQMAHIGSHHELTREKIAMIHNLAFYIYLMGVVDGISDLATFGIISGVIAFIAGFIMLLATDNHQESCRIRSYGNLLRRVGLSAIIIFWIVQAATPSKQTIAAMIVIPAIAENKDIQRLPGEVAHMLNEAVVKWGKDLAGDDTPKRVAHQ